MNIIIDDLQGQAIQALLQAHLVDMNATAPADSVHALDLTELQHQTVTFWSIWDQYQLAGCGAIKRLDATTAEIKSMRTANAFRGQGIASQLLQHIISHAKAQGYQQLSLETGSMAFFIPSHALYAKHGFIECPPFADYQPDPHSIFMTLNLLP
ncbi:GNAT family N-acetyltransferase [Photobacterium kishitanii]|uniref:GNAT family N-acetyltransferase n=1 Tax=Photobacterium kishitanii TaxID=318456 RepID=A0A2T3KGT7_9GAMM|nr:GNAT family N-acetyltransferase [Photobacterium kishitanii]PSU92594.1 GNAT family N-acetyltransferase [Photobacterium kishitanii]PSU98166.1 GNAT family N-acetyltransferase [Photobacterium kishitanii]